MKSNNPPNLCDKKPTELHQVIVYYETSALAPYSFAKTVRSICYLSKSHNCDSFGRVYYYFFEWRTSSHKLPPRKQSKRGRGILANRRECLNTIRYKFTRRSANTGEKIYNILKKKKNYCWCTESSHSQ